MVSIDGRLLALFELDLERAHDRLAPLDLDDDATTRVLERLAVGAHPATALTTVLDLADVDADGWQRLAASDEHVERLAVLAGASDALADLTVRSSEALQVLCGELAAWSTDDVAQRAAAALDDGGAHALADLQRLGALRIALRDLLGMADTPTATLELSHLADGIIAAAYAGVARADAPLAVIAMGKLGGRELNYVSDVDLLFVAHDANAAAGVARALLDVLGAATPAGRVYEVDANLRPEGRDGPLVRSIDAYRAYYDRWAKTWEFQALLKARPVAGDHDLGQQFRAVIEPFVWPEQLGDGAVTEIQAMKGVVERSAPVRAAGARQLKLAPGGLRDIEFAVQLLQLVHGRADDSLRTSNTLDGLTALAAGGYIDDGDANLFSDAYQFLRTVEHRLQLVRMRRTHVVPSDADDRRRLARAVGFRDIRAADALAQFDREFARVQGYVRRLHEKLFYRPLLTRFGELAAREQRQLGTGLDETAARERLAALGFAAPKRAVAHLDALVGGTTRLARVLRTTLPAILPVLAAAPDPDGGLTELRSLCDRLVDNPTLLVNLRDAPPSGELLVTLLGRSRLIGEWLVRDPDLIGNLGDPTGLDEPFDTGALYTQLTALQQRAGDPSHRAAAMGRRLRRELVWTAIRDLSGHTDVEAVTDHLTAVAEAVLDAATRLALADTDGVRLAVIGLGKLGAGELGYASDLDVTVVFDPPDARDAALAAVERMLSLVAIIAPSAPAFTLDLGLRPEGKDGPLARSMESYARYYERWARSWEFLALTQARVVAGDRELGARWLSMVAGHVFVAPAPRDRLSDVRSMKATVERERSRSRNGAIDLKLGAGGLSDIEWTVQLLALAHGGAQPQLREPGTRAGLAAAAAVGHIDDRQHGWLLHGWRTMTQLRNVLYLMGQRNSHVLRDKSDVRAHAAQMLGYDAPGIQRLEEDLRRAMRRVRNVHEQVFY
ncbi:bifunctional [glutamine synthetase] adenylyltransferase/[glutamine synthetase]-adenylyl-L-tyrosine phosphorylase [soil metagenome]